MTQVKDNRAETMKTVAIVTAAGAGVRMGGKVAKQFLEFDGKPLLTVTLERFQHCPAIDAVIAVVPSETIVFCKKEIVDAFALTKVIKVVAGGARRQDSVRAGIEASGGDYELVVIHDGVRPLVDIGLIDRTVEAAKRFRAVITALPAKDTVKQVGEDGLVKRTYDRSRVWLVQTPQAFRYEDILNAHRRALQEGWDDVTDDALLMERMGIPVKVIEGSEANIKITTPHDLDQALFLRSGGKNRSA